MKQLLLLSCIVLSSVYTYANEAWECTSTRKNVTIIATAGYGDTTKTQKIQDAFLKKLVGELDLDELPYKIIILIDPQGFKVENFRNTSGFSSIAYDTIRPVDLSFLWKKVSYESYKALNGNPTTPDTLDFGATFENNLNDVGMKIIFGHTLRDTAYNYDRIYTLIKFAVNNIDEVKKKQRQILLDTYGDSKISITTIDTNLIKSIPTEQLNFDPEKALKRKNIAFPISIFAALIGAFVAIFAGTAAKRKKAKT